MYQVHPRCVTNLNNGFVETLSFQQIIKHLFTEGTVPVRPEPPLRFAIVSYYLLWSYRSSGGATAAGAEALHAVVPKER